MLILTGSLTLSVFYVTIKDTQQTINLFATEIINPNKFRFHLRVKGGGGWVGGLKTLLHPTIKKTVL